MYFMFNIKMGLVMPLKYFKNIKTGEIKRTLKKTLGDDWEEIIKTPNQKFMEKANEATGTSKIKDQDKMLRERARNHSRDVDLDDNIQLNKSNDFQVSQNFLNDKNEKRRKVDDI